MFHKNDITLDVKYVPIQLFNEYKSIQNNILKQMFLWFHYQSVDPAGTAGYTYQ